MKKIILLISLIGCLAQSQIKIENDKFVWKETKFEVETVEHRQPGIIWVTCHSFFKGEKQLYIFECDEQMNVVRFYYAPDKKWYDG